VAGQAAGAETVAAVLFGAAIGVGGHDEVRPDADRPRPRSGNSVSGTP
jgi:hypothetical protein